MLDRLVEEYTYVSNSYYETRWTYYFYKPPAVIESSVSKVLISEIPLIGFCVVIIIVLGMTFSYYRSPERSSSLPEIWNR